MAKKKQNSTHTNDRQVHLTIVTYIKKNPGNHFNNLQRALSLAPGTLQYHLNRMEKANEIVVVRKQYYTRYFPSSMKDPADRKLMVLLRQKIPRTLLMLLIEHSGRTGTELARSLNINKSTLSYYTTRLEKLGVIKIQSKGREKRFSVNQPERISKLLSDYKKSFGDEMVDRFVDLWVRI